MEAQVQAWLLQTQAEGLLDGDAMAAMGEGSDSATSELLQEQFAAHDAWVQSLRASAEEVLRRHRETRSAFARAGISPGNTTDEGPTPEGP